MSTQSMLRTADGSEFVDLLGLLSVSVIDWIESSRDMGLLNEG